MSDFVSKQMQREILMKRVGEPGGCSSLEAANTNEQTDNSDWLSRKGAMALAKRLEAYWHERGYPAARFWAEPIDERFPKLGTYEVYRIVCNLVNGLPPTYR
ncbi:hypothetical protein [Bradyrhizobium acaciae]|uniref:hypothetical protein n=1 Tax=Bradyrhizobium acaciae TaxID=2683706 RepID=UPI001E36719E|nr:hypothetical protein [Bradyrhizobium acaciae]MCC8978904.1 hypothetical protein [Bradyrhizobium acaciae]